MTHLRTGLVPAMDGEAVEASVRWLGQYVPYDVIERIRAEARAQDPERPDSATP